MKGVIIACLAGAFLTMQSTANAAIGDAMGTWQAAILTQGTGFVAALLILLSLGDKTLKLLGRVKPVYRFGGAFAALVLFSNITAFHRNGAAITVSAMLIAQITATLLLEKIGWFGTAPDRLRASQAVGYGLMVAGILCLSL